ncbi:MULTISPECIES: IclR family transcriptional regulator [Actinomadura]|uniref:Glycerol operon regulatory protein n=1 Tax=Actinomadura litoris TaxID=2678616 RepID=A0A7K1KYH1_9ACTN|nr:MULTISPECIES: IclR family transcriptional regulator [Actinomadura]MBT2212257.1 IclR family transcriptional regulator [Actinomadura sp. NEAU-AAG7]MUN37251.1 helix-turn-helix domain-containing protein [Actinomadura litoris]
MARTSNNSSPGEAENGKKDLIQSVSRALAILELFNERRPALTTGEIASLTGLNRATAYRFCQTLLSLGYLEETEARTFRPGLNAISLARAALSSRELPEMARPYLQRLRESTGETVNMALLNGADVVYVARLLNDDLLALRLFVGSRLPVHATSLGRAILAFLPREEVEEILGGGALEAVTQYTITDLDKLSQELDRIRSRGYSLNDEEMVLGIRGVGAPVFNASGRPIAAINVSIARPLDKAELRDVIAPQVVETARAITTLVTELAIDSDHR